MMSEYSPDDHVAAGWTAPSEHGFSADNIGIKPLVEDHQEASQEESVSHEADPFGDESLQQEESAQKPKKKKNPFQKRIDQLVYDKAAVEQNNVFLANQLAEKEAYLAQQQARLQEYEQRMAQKDQHVNEYFENSLDTHEHSLKSKLRQAKENGDIESEIEIIDQLTELKATKSTHASWKAQENARRQYELQHEEYVPQQTNVELPYQPANPIDLELEEWISENQWYNNPKLQTEADSIAYELKNILIFNNQSHIIGTPEFRDSIKNVMRQRYGVGQISNQQEPDDSQDYESYNEYTPRPVVAPVTRRGAVPTMAQNYANNRSNERVGAALTKEEFEMARHLPVHSNKASEIDLINRWKKAKNYPRSPLPGGSPNRLTII